MNEAKSRRWSASGDYRVIRDGELPPQFAFGELLPLEMG
jgi:hypothetical protein